MKQPFIIATLVVSFITLNLAFPISLAFVGEYFNQSHGRLVGTIVGVLIDVFLWVFVREWSESVDKVSEVKE